MIMGMAVLVHQEACAFVYVELSCLMWSRALHPCISSEIDPTDFHLEAPLAVSIWNLHSIYNLVLWIRFFEPHVVSHIKNFWHFDWHEGSKVALFKTLCTESELGISRHCSTFHLIHWMNVVTYTVHSTWKFPLEHAPQMCRFILHRTLLSINVSRSKNDRVIQSRKINLVFSLSAMFEGNFTTFLQLYEISISKFCHNVGHGLLYI